MGLKYGIHGAIYEDRADRVQAPVKLKGTGTQDHHSI